MGSIAEMERNRIKERATERMLQRHTNIVKKLEIGLTIREIAQISDKSTATVQKVKKILK